MTAAPPRPGPLTGPPPFDASDAPCFTCTTTILDPKHGRRRVDPEDWFEEKDNRITSQVLALCRTCPHTAECYEWTMGVEVNTTSAYGIYGATTAKERNNARRRERRKAVEAELAANANAAETKTCAWWKCGRTFGRKPRTNAHNWEVQRFCSRQCAAQWGAVNRVDSRSAYAAPRR